MIVFVQDRPLEVLPPVISLLRMFKAMGEDIVYLGLTRSERSLRILDEIEVQYRFYQHRIVTFREAPLLRVWQKLTHRMLPYWKRWWVWRQINELTKCCADVVLWSSEMCTAAILGDKALEYGCRHVQSLYELGDESGRNLHGFDMLAMLKGATLIECEYNRAHIIMAEKGLARLPFVLPNKPYPHPRTRGTKILDEKAAKVVESWGTKKVFLYQGALQHDRGDLFKLIDLLCKHCPDAIVAAMGRENQATRELAERYSNFSFVPYVAPPHHLEITSHAHIGLAIYKGGAIYGLSPANAVYCAPNKIFEYSGFGMPMLCNDIPGLRYSVGHAGAAVCLEEISDEAVAVAARTLLDSYECYSDHASAFFDSVDTIAVVKKILKFARGVR